MRKIIVTFLAVCLTLSFTACNGGQNAITQQTTSSMNGGNSSGSKDTTTSPTSGSADVSTQASVIVIDNEKDKIKYSGDCKQPYEILTHEHDNEYFTSFTDDWMWISENEHITDELKISEECKEMQLLYCFLEDGHIGAVRYKYIFETNEIAQQAYERMFDNPYGITNYELHYTACYDNVVYVSYPAYASDTKAKKLRHMENDSTLKQYGEGLYASVMAGGAVWEKYILSSFDGIVTGGGEAPKTPIVSAPPEEDNPAEVTTTITTDNSSSTAWDRTYRGEFTDENGEINGVTVRLTTDDSENINYLINYYIGDPENITADVNYGTEKAKGNTLTIANADMGNLDWGPDGTAIVEAKGTVTIVFDAQSLTLTNSETGITYNCDRI